MAKHGPWKARESAECRRRAAYQARGFKHRTVGPRKGTGVVDVKLRPPATKPRPDDGTEDAEYEGRFTLESVLDLKGATK